MNLSSERSFGVVQCTGPDAVTFLNGQLSCDVASLDVGDATYGLVLEPTGHLISQMIVVRDGDENIRLLCPPDTTEAVGTRLQRFMLRTKINIEIGATQLGLVEIVSKTKRDALVETSSVIDLKWPNTGEQHAVLCFADASTDCTVTSENADDAVEHFRIDHGVPTFGLDISEGDVPAVGGRWFIDSSVSFTKGCYVGQELVARVDSRGSNTARRLVVVRGADQLVVGDDLMVANEIVGTVTSASGDIGIARVKRRAADATNGEIGGRDVTLEAAS